jgi:hypothetical protein
MKGFYDVRSALVHGGRLKQKHRARLGALDDLRAHVRRLLRSFVHLAASGHEIYNQQFFQEHLDETLVDQVERGKLRFALGLASEA